MKSSFSDLILASVICAAVFIGYGFWYAAIASKSVEVTGLESQIEAKTEAVSRMASTRAALAEISGDETVVQSYFVPEIGVVAFIDDLQNRGRALEAAVSVLSVSTGGTSAEPALLFSLSVKGTFDAVMRTVGAIEYAPYAISVSGLSVDQDAKNSWHADLKLRVASVSSGTPAGALPTQTP
ncbi:MAG: hypothetical protein KGH56_03340 [Patescibacteria group bacterium]|nr:hypothetical protein [Patescibacteria group bacterium]